MKVVINKCFGGFGLSDAAMLRYFELKGWKCYPSKTRFDTTFWKSPEDQRPIKPTPWSSASMEDRQRYNQEYREKAVYDDDIPRDDPDLVRVVEELGNNANGKFAELAVVEVPDGVDWEIDEYDGNESVAEKHRSWR